MFHNNLCVFITKSVFLYLLHLPSLHKSLVYSPFIYVLYNEYSADVQGEYSSAKYIYEKLRNSEETFQAKMMWFFENYYS